MKGYYTDTCYMGWIPRFRRFIRFASEKDYEEFFRTYER